MGKILQCWQKVGMSYQYSLKVQFNSRHTGASLFPLPFIYQWTKSLFKILSWFPAWIICREEWSLLVSSLLNLTCCKKFPVWLWWRKLCPWLKLPDASYTPCALSFWVTLANRNCWYLEKIGLYDSIITQVQANYGSPQEYRSHIWCYRW